MNYIPILSEDFDGKLQWSLKRDKKSAEIVKKKISSQEFLTDPRRNTIPLESDRLRGLRRIRMANNLRATFAICEDCKKYFNKKFECAFCGEIPDNSIVFFNFDYRGAYPYE